MPTITWIGRANRKRARTPQRRSCANSASLRASGISAACITTPAGAAMTRFRMSRPSLLLWTPRKARRLSNHSRPAIQAPMIVARTELGTGFFIYCRLGVHTIGPELHLCQCDNSRQDGPRYQESPHEAPIAIVFERHINPEQRSRHKPEPHEKREPLH